MFSDYPIKDEGLEYEAKPRNYARSEIVWVKEVIIGAEGGEIHYFDQMNGLVELEVEVAPQKRRYGETKAKAREDLQGFYEINWENIQVEDQIIENGVEFGEHEFLFRMKKVLVLIETWVISQKGLQQPFF